MHLVLIQIGLSISLRLEAEMDEFKRKREWDRTLAGVRQTVGITAPFDPHRELKVAIEEVDGKPWLACRTMVFAADVVNPTGGGAPEIDEGILIHERVELESLGLTPAQVARLAIRLKDIQRRNARMQRYIRGTATERDLEALRHNGVIE